MTATSIVVWVVVCLVGVLIGLAIGNRVWRQSLRPRTGRHHRWPFRRDGGHQ